MDCAPGTTVEQFSTAILVDSEDIEGESKGGWRIREVGELASFPGYGVLLWL